MAIINHPIRCKLNHKSYYYCRTHSRKSSIFHPNHNNSATDNKIQNLRWRQSKRMMISISYFFSSFSASAAFFILTPTCRSFILSTRSLAYALNDFISSVTLTSSTEGCSRTMGRYGPWTWVAVASSSGEESPAWEHEQYGIRGIVKLVKP